LLPFGRTIDDIQRGISKLRNRVISRVFQELGVIEQWGSGIQRMTAACRDCGLDAPRFEEIGTHFRVTLSAVVRGAPVRDTRDERILTTLESIPMLVSPLRRSPNELHCPPSDENSSRFVGRTWIDRGDWKRPKGSSLGAIVETGCIGLRSADTPQSSWLPVTSAVPFACVIAMP
jgi:hypothetical protein